MLLDPPPSLCYREKKLVPSFRCREMACQVSIVQVNYTKRYQGTDNYDLNHESSQPINHQLLLERPLGDGGPSPIRGLASAVSHSIVLNLVSNHCLIYNL